MASRRPPKTERRPPHVAVAGSSRPTPAEATAAEAVGRGLAEGGAIVVCGGLGGVMEAACRGARSAAGTTVGLLPGDDRRRANPYVDVVLPTGLGEARNALVARGGEVLVAIGGGHGTLAEIALALRGGTPVVALDTWRFSGPSDADDPLERAATAEEAVRLALEHVSAPHGADRADPPTGG